MAAPALSPSPRVGCPIGPFPTKERPLKKIAPLLAALACAPLSTAQAQNVRQVSLVTNDIIYDAHTAKIYASVPSSVGVGGNSITPVDPVTGTVGPSVFVGSEPNRLAVSDDGQFLYVGLDGAAAVRRVSLPTQTAGLQFSLGSASFFGNYNAAGLAVLPGNPHSVAVARRYTGVSPDIAGVAVFDDAVQRPTTTPDHDGAYFIKFNPATGVLYGTGDYGSTLYTMTPNATGIVNTSSYAYLANADLSFDGGLIYSSSGQAVDPTAQALLGSFTGFPTTYFGGSSTSLASDAANGRVFFLTGDPTGNSSTAQIFEYDTATYRPVGALTLSGVSGRADNLIAYGANGLAFRTSGGQLFLIDSRSFPGLASLTLSATNLAAGAAATGTVTLTQSAPADGATVTLSATNTQAITVPASVTVPAGARTATFPLLANTVTTTTNFSVTAAYGSQSCQATLAVQDTAGDPGYPAGVRSLNLPSNDLIYDRVTAKIYASIPSGAVVPGGRPGNSIVGFDPLTGVMDAPVFIGSEPGKLALSDNGQSLFVGLNGAAAVRHLDLPTDSADPLFHLGGDASFDGPFYPNDIQVLPGSVNSVAISERIYVFGPGQVGLGIYDNGVQRPNALGQYPYQIDTLAFSASPSRLYGSNGNLVRLNVSSSGVAVGDVPTGGAPGGAIKFDSGLLFSTNGKVIDPEAASLVGTFSGVPYNANVQPDVADGRVFFVSSPNFGNDGTALIQAFDPNTFLPVGSLTVSGVAATPYAGPSSLIRWGADGLAFRSGGQVFLVRTSLIPNTQPAPALVTLSPAQVVGGGATTGTVTLSAPAPAGGVTVWLSSSNSDVASFPASVTVAAGRTSATFAVATRPVTASATITVSAVSGGATASAPLAVQPPTHTHLLWNNSDGRVMLWSVAGDGSFTLNGFGPYTDGAPQNVWHATAVATGADGVSHLLWNNTDGRVMLWTVDDSGNFSLAGYGPYTDGAANNKWSATAVSVGPDNVVHLLWNNTDHRVMLWNVDSAFNFSLAGYGPYTDTSVSGDSGNLWSAAALATGPDGKSRIAWNNADGRVMLWDVDSSFNFTLAGYGPYTDGAPQNKWSVTGASVGPDNLTHLLWSNTDRRAMFWNVDSAFNFTLAGYGPYTDNGANNLWSATALATGPDGLSHLLWGNTDNRAMLWGLDPSFNFTVAGYGPYTDNGPGNLWSATAVSAGP